ncbi:MAG: hypothetical protein ACRDYE_07570 [Acidimicrobiales bacterium]
MRRNTIERRLSDAHQRLVRARAELAVVDEQLPVVDEVADDTRLRAMVSETPASAKERDEASRQAGVMHKTRDTLVGRIVDLERRQAQLLDQLAIGPG